MKIFKKWKIYTVYLKVFYIQSVCLFATNIHLSLPTAHNIRAIYV